MKSVNSDVNWTECEWFYREIRTSIKIDSVKRFLTQNEILNTDLIMMRLINSVRVADVLFTTLRIQESRLSEKYQNFTNIFNENEEKYLS